MGASLLATSRVAQAQSAPDPAAAALFRSGRDLLAAGDWTGACAKFEASMARYAAASTQLNIAKCREHEGKLASAWAAYKQAIVLNQSTPGEERRQALEEIAVQGAADLEPRLPHLRVVVKAPPPELVVKQDGLQVMLGESLPIDPGEHVVTAEAPGHRSERRTVTLVEGKPLTVELVLVAETKATTPPVTTSPAAAPPPKAAPSERPSEDEGGGIPGWTLGVGIVGLAFGGVATGFAVDAIDADRDAKAVCGADTVCDETRGEDFTDTVPDTERKNRDIGLAVGFGVGAVLAIGTALVGIASSGSSRAGATSSLGVWTTGSSAFAGGRF